LLTGSGSLASLRALFFMGSKAEALRGKWQHQRELSKKQSKSKKREKKGLPERPKGEGPSPLVQERS
jgi:hypothetical protein